MLQITHFNLIDPKWPTSCGSNLHLNSETCRLPRLWKPAFVKNPHLCSKSRAKHSLNLILYISTAEIYEMLWNAVSETLFFKILRCLVPSAISSPPWWLMICQGDQHCFHSNLGSIQSYILVTHLIYSINSTYSIALILYSSERIHKSNIDGTLLTEAKYINLSLHYLEQVCLLIIII